MVAAKSTAVRAAARRRRRLPRTAGAVAAAGCAMALVAGCGAAAGGGSAAAAAPATGGEAKGAGAPGTAGDPAAAVRDAADALVRAGSARVGTQMRMASGGTWVTVTGTGSFDFTAGRGRLTLVLPRDAAGAQEHKPVTELLTPGALYMKDRGEGVPEGKWVRVDTTALPDGNLVTGGATDPLAAAAKGFAVTGVPFEAWLDAQGRLRKLTEHFTYGPAATGVGVQATTSYDAFGSAVPFALPAGADIWTGKIVSAP